MLMNTLFPSCSIFHPLRAAADSVADTCSSKVASFCVILYANCAPSTGSPITNNFNKMHNIITPKAVMPILIFFFTGCSSSNSNLLHNFRIQIISDYTIKLVNSSTAALEYMRKARTVFCPDFLAQSSIDSAYVRRKEIQDVWKSVNTVPLFTWKNVKTRVCLYQR